MNTSAEQDNGDHSNEDKMHDRTSASANKGINEKLSVQTKLPNKHSKQVYTCSHCLVCICGEVTYKNSPIRGWGGLSKMSNKMSKIELSQLGQDLFDFSGLTWAYPLTHPCTHR